MPRPEFTYTVSVPRAATTFHREESTYQTDSYGTARRVAMKYASAPVSNGYARVTNNATGETVWEYTRPGKER